MDRSSIQTPCHQTFSFHPFLLLAMGIAGDKTSRRSSLTQFFTSAHQHHEQIVRKRAQSLHAQSTRENSILIHDTSPFVPEIQPSTLDRKSVLKLSISAPLSASAPNRPFASDTGSASSSNLRTSFIETRPHEELPTSSERKVQFVEPKSPPQHLHAETSGTATSTSTMRPRRIRKRTVARVSIATGKLYYIQEPIPEYPFPSTCASPPPSPSYARNRTFLRRRSYQHHTSRAGNCPHLFGSNPSPELNFHCSPGCKARRRQSSASTPTSSTQSEREYDYAESPLYNSASEKFHAHWGTFTLNMRFSMFRAQDRMKDGVAWMDGIVRRMKIGRDH